MPVYPVISLDQIAVIAGFLILLFGVMWLVRRHRGGIVNRLHSDRRMHHIEDLSLAPQQRLHLIEVDCQTFLVHVGKGHAASLIAVERLPSANAFETGKLRALQPNPRQKSKSAAKQPSSITARKPKSALGTAIANARRNNPSLGFEK